MHSNILMQFEVINYAVYNPSICLDGRLLHASSMQTTHYAMIQFTTLSPYFKLVFIITFNCDVLL